MIDPALLTLGYIIGRDVVAYFDQRRTGEQPNNLTEGHPCVGDSVLYRYKHAVSGGCCWSSEVVKYSGSKIITGVAVIDNWQRGCGTGANVEIVQG
jgi:hypothetical protein